MSFSHKALNLEGKSPLVYTAMSKHLFYFRMHISCFVLQQGKVPLNPFLLFDYFFIDKIDRNLVREANNSLLHRADLIWVFGPVSNGVLAEIIQAQKDNKAISYFNIEKSQNIIPASYKEIKMEDEVKEFKSLIIH